MASAPALCSGRAVAGVLHARDGDAAGKISHRFFVECCLYSAIGGSAKNAHVRTASGRDVGGAAGGEYCNTRNDNYSESHGVSVVQKSRLVLEPDRAGAGPALLVNEL